MADLKISELNYVATGVSIDDMVIPIDDGQNTYQISVSDFNVKGTNTAREYANQAGASATLALSYANDASDYSAAALSYKDLAVSAKDSAESQAGYAFEYATEALNARNDAVAARNTINTAAATVSADVALVEAAAESALSSKNLAETAASNAADSATTANQKYMLADDAAQASEAWATGSVDDVPVTSDVPQYENNAKYYAEQAAASASTAATAVVNGPYVGNNGHWFVWSWNDNAYVDTNIAATGPAGNGIASIAKTGTSGKVDTYTITFTDGTTFPYTVTNGEDGQGSGDMLMTDYDHDQDVYNAGGIPAFVASATTNKMATDGSNAATLVDMKSNVILGTSEGTWTVNSISKAAGTEENVTIVETASASSDGEAERWWTSLGTFYRSNVGNPNIYYVSNNENIYLVIDSVSVVISQNYDLVTATVTAHLADDFSDAISLSNVALHISNYINSNRRDSLVCGTVNTVKGYGLNYGRYNSIEGDYSSVLGAGNYVDGDYSHATGSENAISGDYNHVEGFRNYVNGSKSFVNGDNNHCSASDSVVTGQNNAVYGSNKLVAGTYNDDKNDTILELGNGTSSGRSNAFEVYDDGSISQNNGTDKFKLAVSGGAAGYYHNNDPFATFDKVSIATSGTPSSTDAKKQQITINGSATDIGNSFYMEQSLTLSTSADVTCTFTNSGITANSRIDPYTSDYSIVPKNVVASAGSCTLTFAQVSTASTINVGIEVKN